MKRFTKEMLWYSNEWIGNPMRVTVLLNKNTIDNVRICQALIKAGTMHSANISVVPESFTDEEGKTMDWQYDHTLLVVHDYHVEIVTRNVENDEVHFERIKNEELFDLSESEHLTQGGC